ncbi:MAG: DUF4870 domain-containing protein [Bacteroidia bacterium]|nr:DUF4870 domain-containing protein [Bacteroidia bacterium]NNF30860.1 DUF4870 domain-containing protein [Flavobacteriaceae bacterium]MBT8275433.1 DUF4870 domain-containing protein [Bacteroidia bacterium]NNJ81945.1 DUF4870 domain-containing protein [Flavobacteriaceae bacterium]NNK54473.1 DUF4870 domain-containing protein [Flavobacteriaceae bacterium]
MEPNPSENQKQLGALIHLSTFSKFFFPFGNFLVPLILWSFNKDKSFVDEHGRQAINFQLSILVYSLVIGLICIPFFLIFATDFISLVEAIEHTVDHVSVNNATNLSGFVILFSIVALLLFGLFLFELYAVISATMKAARGELYQYPLSIPFIKTNIKNQSTHEHSN